MTHQCANVACDAIREDTDANDRRFQSNMLSVILKFRDLLTREERRRGYLLLCMMLLMAVLDVVGVASILPFIAVLANPEVVETNPWLNQIFVRLGFVDVDRFLFFLGTAVFCAMLVSISFKALTTWAIMHFTQMRHYAIARRLVEGYLRQPYEWYLNRHSADLGKMALSEVQLVVVGSLMPLMHLLSHGSIVLAMLCLLVLVDPVIALAVGGGIGGAYGVTFLSLRRFLSRLGKERVTANALRYKELSETFGGIKEVKLHALESSRLERFDRPAKAFARTQIVAQAVGAMPRYVLEILAFGTLLLLILILMRRSDGFEETLPLIALYALAGYRLMPALQTAYSNATKLRFSGDALDQLQKDLASLGDFTPPTRDGDGQLIPNLNIGLDSVSFTYAGAENPALSSVSLTVAARSTVGIIGKTGSGKSTMVDIILGLLEPQEGRVFVDGTSIGAGNRRKWQRTLGYVPQQIFLSDETIAQNIAYGEQADRIDMDAVQLAANIANLHDFIVDELPQGYDTRIGERGVRLSGGQRQRIGIARALYNRPSVLILDEATSALDNLTEQAVMDAVHGLSGEITIIMIAHRLTTLRECDKVFVLERGSLVGEGTYADVVEYEAQKE